MGENGADLAISRDRYQAEREHLDYNPPPGDLKLIRAIEKKYQEKDRHKRSYEKTWFISHAGIVGQHNLVFNDLTRAYEVPYRSPAHRQRVQVNKIKPYFRRTIARLTAHRPGLFVVPANNDEKSAEIAKHNTLTIDSEFDRVGFQERLKDNLGWMLETGNMLFYLRWNPYAGPILNGEDGEDLTDDYGRALHVGDVELETLSPYEFEIDPHARCLEEAGWCMRNTIKTIEWVRENYPEMGRFVKGEDVYVHQFYLKRHKQLVGVYGYATEDSAKSDWQTIESSVVVHEYWERPTMKYPRGRLVVVAGGVLLYNREIPYRKMLSLGFWCPIVHTGEVKVPGRFWYQAVIEDMFPLNRTYNKARSMEEENRMLHGRPKVLVPRTAKMRQTSFDAEPGEKIDYSPGPNGEKPEVMYPQSTAAATESSIQHTLADIDDVSSYHESSRGLMPSANAPAAALDKLQSADETSLGLTEGYLRDFICKLGRMWLSLCAEFWTEDRIARVGGTTGSWTAYAIKGDMLSGDTPGNYHDVRMIPNSTMWRDPKEQRAQIKELIETGVLIPDVHREVIVKALDQYHLNAIFDDDEIDRSYACRENDILRSGGWSEPRDFENHKIHIHTHDRFRKSEAYRNLPQELQEAFDAHVYLHKQMAIAVEQEKVGAMVQAQAPAQMAQIQGQQAMKAPPPGAEAQGGVPSPGGAGPAPAPGGGAPMGMGAPGGQPLIINIIVGGENQGSAAVMPDGQVVPIGQEGAPVEEEMPVTPDGAPADEEDLYPFSAPPEGM